MNRGAALSTCMDEGSIVTVPSLGSDVYLKFSGGSFVLCDADGSNERALTSLPTDADGWSVYTEPTEEEVAFHVNITSLTPYISLVGSEKFTQREANSSLRRLVLATPLLVQPAA